MKKVRVVLVAIIALIAVYPYESHADTKTLYHLDNPYSSNGAILNNFMFELETSLAWGVRVSLYVLCIFVCFFIFEYVRRKNRMCSGQESNMINDTMKDLEKLGGGSVTRIKFLNIFTSTTVVVYKNEKKPH